MTANRISQTEVAGLPRWARIALAARCIRRARALVHPAPEPDRVLQSTLTALDHAVSGAKAHDDLPDAAAAAYTLALDNVDRPGVADEDGAIATCMLAHAAAFAAEAATLADGLRAAHLVAQSVDFAIHACRLRVGDRSGDAVAAMHGDLTRLQAQSAGWTDDSAVPEDFFTAGL